MTTALRVDASRSSIAYRTLWAVIALTAIAMTVQTSSVNYSPDSWSYVDIARSLTDPDRAIGSILGARDYVNEPWFNDSFPFLWPALLAPGIALWGPTSPIGGYLFIVVWLLTCLVVDRMARFLLLPRVAGPVLGLAVLGLPGYVDEGQSGRSIPLNVLLALSAAYVLLKMRDRDGFLLPLVLGTLTGLCAANRFDSLAYGPIFIFIAWRLRFMDWRQVAVASLTWVAFPLVWVGYSSARLGGIYVTDNGRVVTSPVPTFVTDWPGAVPDRAGGVPAVVARAFGNAHVVAWSVGHAFLWWMLAALTASLVAIVLVQVRAGRCSRALARWIAGARSRPQWRAVDLLAYLALGLGALQMLLMLASGYGDPRYWDTTSSIVLVAIAGTAGSLCASTSVESLTRRRLWLVSTTSGFLTLIAALGLLQTAQAFRTSADQTAGDAAVVSCISRVDGTVMFSGREAFRIPATTRFRAASPPANTAEMAAADWTDLKDQYGVVAWYNSSGGPEGQLPTAAEGILDDLECPAGT